jgi:hypothetical protein
LKAILLNILFDPCFFPAFASKDLLLIMGLTFMAMGISQMAYCLLRMKQKKLGEMLHG